MPELEALQGQNPLAAQEHWRPGVPFIRVMLVDDHAVVRAGYRRLLELERDMRVIGEHGDADAAYRAVNELEGELDVMVLDLSMPGRSGLEVLQRLRQRWPQVRVLVFSMHEGAAMVQQALKAGAAAYVSKSAKPEELVQVLRRVAQAAPNEPPLLSSELRSAMQGAPGSEARAPHERLSVREFDVLMGLLRGESIETIAASLRLSVKTVANYQSSIRQQLGVGSALELMRYARSHGLDMV